MSLRTLSAILMACALALAPQIRLFAEPQAEEPIATVLVHEHQHEHQRETGQPREPAAPAAFVALGKQVFLQNCAGCHGQDAGGKVGPRLVGTPHSTSEIRNFVTHGIPPKMPPFGERLKADDIAAVAAYVRSLGPPAADHEHGGMDHDHGAMGHDHEAMGHDHGAMEHSHGMMAPRVAGQEMSREGSGTSWQPEASPMWAKHSMWGKWAIMQHGNVFLMYDAQTGPRGVSRPVSANWYMAMGSRPLGRGELMLRAMLSLEPATFGNNGQPQLFQTGEGLIDRQHPHDLFMEIATQYSYPLSRNLGAYLYLAPVGEPALGPTAFMHRVSAMDIPTAPLTHHWADSTHISYGVITGGIQSKRLKAEVSWFNGHEPDGNRWDIDPLALNSVSGRLSYAPNANWVLQVSRGHIDKPEIHYEPGQGSVDRTTFSAQYTRPTRHGFLAGTFVWGRNEGSGTGAGSGASDGFLVEGNYNWADRNYLFSRIERVDKDELFPDTDPRSANKYLVNAFSLGYAHDIGHLRDFETALGVMATVYAKDSGLDKTYGDFPIGVQVFLRVRPRRMSMSMGGHAEHEHGSPGEHREHEHGSASSERLSALLARELAVATGKLGSSPEDD